MDPRITPQAPPAAPTAIPKFLQQPVPAAAPPALGADQLQIGSPPATAAAPTAVPPAAAAPTAVPPTTVPAATPAATVPAAAPAVAAAPAQQAPAAAPTADGGTQLAILAQTLRSGSSADAAMAASQIVLYGGTHRQQAIALLVEALNSGDSLKQHVALDGLMRLKAVEALPQLQNAALTGDAGIRSMVNSTVTALGGGPPQPAPQFNVVPPGQAPQPGAPAAQPQALSPAAAQLVQQLQSPSTIAEAGLALSSLPTPQLIAVARAFVAQSYGNNSQGLGLLALTLLQRAHEPGVLDVLPSLLKGADAPLMSSDTKTRIAFVLAGSANPEHFKAALRVVADPQLYYPTGKQLVVDRIAKNPAALAHPATSVTLAAVLHVNERPGLSAAASHALAGIKTATARDALANSPLFSSEDPKMRMRALWDLGAHPAPYPPKAIEHMKRLAKAGDPQVIAKAKELLQKSGVKV